MKVILDANLSPRVAKVLHADGHQTLHVGDVGMLTAADATILEWAAEHGYTVVTADSDFAALLSRGRSVRPSVIHMRAVANKPFESHAALLIESLPVLEEALTTGAIVSLSPTKIQVRDLPIG
ncbi:MAG: DUF5615 family PIN-like protein [Acidimicrobiaceae bacterium]|nr:DUF5615 family PIN-like protein [Acidimicrobiaceae bacterium]